MNELSFADSHCDPLILIVMYKCTEGLPTRDTVVLARPGQVKVWVLRTKLGCFVWFQIFMYLIKVLQEKNNISLED